MDLETKSLNLGSRPALIVVDMINGFTDPACPLGFDCPEVITANVRLLTKMREKHLPIFFTAVVFKSTDQAKVFRSRVPALEVLTSDSHWVKIDSKLEQLESEPIIEKWWASAFFGTGLDEQLKKVKADSLIVTGLTTSGCVRATVVDGLQHDYAVVVPREAVGDRNLDAHAANLFDMHAKYADVMNIDDVLKILS